MTMTLMPSNTSDHAKGIRMNQRGKRIQASSTAVWFRSAYPDTLLRMAADLISTNLSIVMGIVVWYFFYVLLMNHPQPRDLETDLLKLTLRCGWLWSRLALGTLRLHARCSRRLSYQR